MATIVCQGLESTTLILKLSSPKPLLHSLELALNPNCTSESNEFKFQKPDNGGWTFLQDLSNSNSSLIEEKNVYVHPMTKRYSSKLSEKSLELCTESLGSETGSDISPEYCFLFESPISSPKSEEEKEKSTVRTSISNSPLKQNLNLNLNRRWREPYEAVDRSFPPPLTTMSGAEPLQVRSRREGGRLIITAVAAPAASSCFQAERSGGRLRVSFAGDSDFSDEEIEDEEEDEEENAGNDSYEEEEEEEEERDTEGNDVKVGGEFAIRRRRCKEGEIEKNGLMNWEPFWVAT